MEKCFELMILQLKLITNEIQLLRKELISNTSSSTVSYSSSITPKYDFQLNTKTIICRRCKQEAQIPKISCQNNICSACVFIIVNEFESDDDDIEIK